MPSKNIKIAKGIKTHTNTGPDCLCWHQVYVWHRSNLVIKLKPKLIQTKVWVDSATMRAIWNLKRYILAQIYLI